MQEELKLQCESYSKDLHKCYKTYNGECQKDCCQVYRLLQEVDYEKGCRNVLGAKVHELQQALTKIENIILDMPRGYWGQAHIELLEIINKTKK